MHRSELARSKSRTSVDLCDLRAASSDLNADTRCGLLAPNPIIVAVEVRAITRFASANGCGACSACLVAIAIRAIDRRSPA